jgi:O-antigen/teichoic acid export membrane protein
LLVAAALALLLFAVGSAIPVPPAWGALAAVVAGANVLLQCRLVLWQNQRRPIAVAAVQIGGALLNIGLSLVAVLLIGCGGEGRNAGAAIAAVAMAGLAAASLLLSGEARPVWQVDHVRALLRFGVPLVPHAAAGILLATADRFVVSADLGAGPLGIYGAAAQLGAVMAILADAFVKAYNPWLYERLAAHELSDSLAVVGAAYASVPGFLLLAIAVGAVLFVASQLLLGPAYRDGAGLLPWFVLGGACSGIYLALSGLFFFAGRTGLLGAVTLPCALGGLAINVLLVHRLGVAGAAMGYAAAQALLAATTWLVASRSFDLPWRQPTLALRTWWGQALAPAKRAAR